MDIFIRSGRKCQRYCCYQFAVVSHPHSNRPRKISILKIVLFGCIMLHRCLVSEGVFPLFFFLNLLLQPILCLNRRTTCEEWRFHHVKQHGSLFGGEPHWIWSRHTRRDTVLLRSDSGHIWPLLYVLHEPTWSNPDITCFLYLYKDIKLLICRMEMKCIAMTPPVSFRCLSTFTNPISSP